MAAILKFKSRYFSATVEAMATKLV